MQSGASNQCNLKFPITTIRRFPLVQSEASQSGDSAAAVGDVDGVDAVGNHTVACEGLPDIAFAYGNHCDGFLVRIGSYLKAAVHISDKGKINLG